MILTGKVLETNFSHISDWAEAVPLRAFPLIDRLPVDRVPQLLFPHFGLLLVQFNSREGFRYNGSASVDFDVFFQKSKPQVHFFLVREVDNDGIEAYTVYLKSEFLGLAVVAVLLQIADRELLQWKSALVRQPGGIVGHKVEVCLKEVQIAVVYILAVLEAKSNFGAMDHSAVVFHVDAALLPAAGRIVGERRIPFDVLYCLQIFG